MDSSKLCPSAMVSVLMAAIKGGGADIACEMIQAIDNNCGLNDEYVLKAIAKLVDEYQFDM